MNYETWSRLFGRTPDDPDVAAAVATAGIVKTLSIGSDELSVAADIAGQGMTILFTDESILRPQGGSVGLPILSSVGMLLQHPSVPHLYKGPLPFGLSANTTQDAMRQRFGAPIEVGESRPWEIFSIDGLELCPTYSRDLQSIARLALSLPGSR